MNTHLEHLLHSICIYLYFSNLMKLILKIGTELVTVCHEQGLRTSI